jgi:hypothetical protein
MLCVYPETIFFHRPRIRRRGPYPDPKFGFTTFLAAVNLTAPSQAAIHPPWVWIRLSTQGISPKGSRKFFEAVFLSCLFEFGIAATRLPPIDRDRFVFYTNFYGRFRGKPAVSA